MQNSNIYRAPSRPVRPKIPARLWRWPRGVCKASGAPATACTRLLTFRAAGFLYPFCLALPGWGMQNQTAPVAFTTARVPNGPLQKVFEQDGYRWTEGSNRSRHFRRSDCDIVPGRVAFHFTPQRAVLLGPYPYSSHVKSHAAHSPRVDVRVRVMKTPIVSPISASMALGSDQRLRRVRDSSVSR